MRLRGYSPSAVPALSYVGSPDGFVVGGLPGRAATVTVGSTSTGSAGSSATVANSGTSNAAVLDFTIPRGADSTISIGTVTTGSPGSSATVTNSGTSGAAVLNFTIPQGVAGSATINGITATEIGRLVCRTANGLSGTEDGANTWARIATFSPGSTQNSDAAFLYGVTSSYANSNDNAILSVTLRTSSTGNNPFAYVAYSSKPGATLLLAEDAFRVTAGGFGTDFQLWVRKSATFGALAFYEISRNISTVGGWSVTYNNNAAWQSASPTGAVLNVNSAGVTAFGVPVLTTTNTATVTNKTLTSPRVNQINDTNGNIAATFPATASAVNYLQVSNSATNTSPTITAVGSDSSVAINLIPKGSAGSVNLRGPSGPAVQAYAPASSVNFIQLSGSVTGVTTSISALGSDTNVGINLVPKGTGTVQANGVDLVTTTGVQSLSAKTLTSPTITGTVSADMLLSGTRTTQYEAVGVSDGSRLTVGSTTHNGVGPTFFIPQIHNQLAYLIRRGGTVTVTRNGSPATLTSAAVMFEPNNLFAELSGGVSTNDSVVIEVDFSTVVSPTTSLQFGSTAGVDSRVGQSARNVTIEGWNSVTLAWESIGSITSNSTGMFARYFTGNDARTKLRYTFTNFVGTTFRITSLFAFANTSADVEGALFSRAGGALYGTNAAPPTLTAAGGDANISLNLASKGTGTVNVNGSPVITGANSLSALVSSTSNTIGVGNIELGHASDTTISRSSAGMVSVEGNPLAVRVAVPATTTSTGVSGQFAADSTHVYICTATNTWRRAALSTW